MTVVTVSAGEVRKEWATILGRLQESKQPMVITDRGKAEAVLLSIEQYDAMLDLLEDREDELDIQLGKRLNDDRQSYAAGEQRDFESFLNEVD